MTGLDSEGMSLWLKSDICSKLKLDLPTHNLKVILLSTLSSQPRCLMQWAKRSFPPGLYANINFLFCSVPFLFSSPASVKRRRRRIEQWGGCTQPIYCLKQWLQLASRASCGSAVLTSPTEIDMIQAVHVRQFLLLQSPEFINLETQGLWSMSTMIALISH